MSQKYKVITNFLIAIMLQISAKLLHKLLIKCNKYTYFFLKMQENFLILYILLHLNKKKSRNDSKNLMCVKCSIMNIFFTY